jgi:hypothetical protein
LTHARIKTSKEIDRHRRRFFGGAALTLESRQRGGDASGDGAAST